MFAMKLEKYVDFQSGNIFVAKIPPNLSDQLIAAFFQKTDGYYVDVGANDPIKNSQTYELERLGWNGLLIEPLPDCCERLKAMRTGKVLQYVCSTRKSHRSKLILNVAGSLSTLENKLMSPQQMSSNTIEVEARTLDSLLSENDVKAGFDLLSIDVEGHEMSLFDGFSINQWRPKLIVLEDHVLDLNKHNFMVSNQYKLLFRVGLNAWYITQELPYKLSILAKLELFRKYYLATTIRKFQFWRRGLYNNINH